ncbi:hypothetical protein H5J24_00145 [Chryseobacterium capnotolerans]|uniref:hypothetical protein n=1 Tax=Chryseobacterium TaxID=59732 RepID=UPI00083A1CEA|nr:MULTISPECIES: hypothetical protein [Chryseobacterium]UHO38657.1 hypothetical protein H5J24_00145 [Chryseobacterium capnotolerans]
MKQILFILFFLSACFNAQVIKDSILGKPKFVKEYVLFLNDSRPYTFLSNDSEYGHAVIMTPKNLRNRMQDTWFETDFCRYINNETFYDKNRNITKETWYYKSGKIVDDYNYVYDSLNRLTTQNTRGYSESTRHYFYDGNSKTAKFSELYYKRKDEPMKKYGNNLESFNPLFITKFDAISKTDSIFAITNDIWKKVGKGYTEGKDSIYHQKLNRIKMYDDQYKIIEEKYFDYKSDYQNKKISLGRHLKYEYDEHGNIIKQTDFNNGKILSYIIYENGKIIKTESIDDDGKKTYTIYIYTKDQKLKQKTMYYKEKLWQDSRYEYKGNYIIRLIYLDKPILEDKIVEPIIINFKYKFDKQKNWTEIIKNINGKDLYKWIRKIEYY